MKSEDRLRRLRNEYKKDSELKSISNKVTYTALISIAICLSGISIHKANTFLFELEFSSPAGLSVLLSLALIFLLIRYHGYANYYFHQLNKISYDRFSNHPEMISYDKDTNILFGYIGEFLENENSTETMEHEFKINWVTLKMYVIIYVTDMNGEKRKLIKSLNDGAHYIGKAKRIQLTRLFFLSKIKDYTSHPDHLNLLTPYLISTLGIVLMLAKFICPTFIPNLMSHLN